MIAISSPAERSDFSRHRLAMRENAFDPGTFAEIANAVEILVTTERSYLPTHKKGGTVAYSTLCAKAALLTEIYTSARIASQVADITGLSTVPTPDHDESSCSVLFYEKPGDHIGWLHKLPRRGGNVRDHTGHGCRNDVGSTEFSTQCRLG